jgi:hypothetical protein
MAWSPDWKPHLVRPVLAYERALGDGDVSGIHMKIVLASPFGRLRVTPLEHSLQIASA